ncbi:MAG: MgtC/SapB family protein [Bacteroidia bacterium]
MEDIISQIPPDLLKFLLVTVFSLLIGLEQRRHNISEPSETLFGTDRTFTLIGIAGFMLYVISPQNLLPFAVGGIIIGGLLALYYFQKIKIQQRFGMTSLITALITYSLAPLLYTQKEALVLLLVVVVLVITEIKENLRRFTTRFDNDEFISLAKFLVLAGVILPLLPDAPVSSVINISPYKFWLAIVVVSGISYFSYLLRKFVFPDTGILLTGLLGGLYSSTATTVILARKSNENIAAGRIIGAMFLALTMMYIRIFLLALFFNSEIATLLLPKFIALIIISSLIALYFTKIRKTTAIKGNEQMSASSHQNPLEFKTALLFGGLFIVFAIVTQFVIKNYGSHGVSLLAFVVGVTDIDPFIINLFQGKLDISAAVITIAVLNAITSNNVLKLIYALSLSNKSLRKELIISFGLLIAAGVVCSII